MLHDGECIRRIGTAEAWKFACGCRCYWSPDGEIADEWICHQHRYKTKPMFPSLHPENLWGHIEDHMRSRKGRDHYAQHRWKATAQAMMRAYIQAEDGLKQS